MTAAAPITTSTTRSCTAGSVAWARYSFGEQGGRQFRLLQLVRCWVSSAPRATPGGAATQRPGRPEDWAARPCRSSRRRVRSVSCSPCEPPREVGHVGGAHGHQCAVRRLVRLVQTYRSQHPGDALPESHSAVTWRKSATAQTRLGTSSPRRPFSAKLTAPRQQQPPLMTGFTGPGLRGPGGVILGVAPWGARQRASQGEPQGSRSHFRAPPGGSSRWGGGIVRRLRRGVHVDVASDVSSTLSTRMAVRHITRYAVRLPVPVAGFSGCPFHPALAVDN